MTLRHMRIFVTVYQCNSITKAAKALHLAQPSVSLAVGELERYYGVKLFDRIAKRLYVTEQGKKFYNYAIHIVSLFDEMEKGIRDWDRVGAIRIGASITIGNYILPNRMEVFKQMYPDIQVSVMIKNSTDLEEEVRNNQIDFALVEGMPAPDQMMAVPFMKDKLCFICQTSHPLAAKESITLSEAAAQEFLLRESGSAGRELFEGILAVHDLSVVPIWESISTQAIVKAVSRGLGVSVLPYLLVKSEVEEGQVKEIPIEGVDLTRDFSIIYHKNKYLTPSAKAFMELLGVVVSGRE